MPELENPRYECFAQGLARGLSKSGAYKEAGYKANRAHASRLAANGNIRARVAELQAEAAKKVVSAIAFDAVSLFTRLEHDIQLAQEAGEHNAAMRGRIAMIEAFGFTKDSPTITHEAVLGKTIKSEAPSEEKAPDASPPGGRFAHMLAELNKPIPGH